MKNQRIGSLYLSSKHFLDEANQTIGKAGISLEVLSNRRNVTSKLSEEGKSAKEAIIAKFKAEYNLDIKLQWDKYCGCTMCPCSPGFKIVVETETTAKVNSRNADDYRFQIWVNEANEIEFFEPKNKRILTTVTNAKIA